ncbi:conserved hypothetical protein [Afipia carboxidovorans OM5]|uniref:Uncharacterized protein n=1 Tax=Afipia carboxidovorans (strain ATCC 49405 / DSM 1227 / KCTC 32145 / OM5) TaxID=504832 RepID=B6JCI2_AFIC5|nr:hypothetical protein [Afipia carboxidovorans]ACI91562.1 conserved hypothetical protein [Afipia carboxidovorans OM5]AEI01273.1 hypothetical protein OCA4_c01150 [Afipia carboxidovorans OM4]AEI04847.1 hypothetical protein OCA5_c01150 [Afipia carboxidovorans OM5]
MMMISRKTLRRAAAAALMTLTAALAPAVPALAADAVFPAGVRIGLVPLDGLTPSKEFSGFISGDQRVRIGLSEIPEAAYTAAETAAKQENMPVGAPKPQVFETTTRKGYLITESGKEGDTEVANYTLLLPGNKFTGYAIVQVRGEAGETYSEANIRKMLATAVTRPEVPVDEQLAQLGFKIGDLAGFKHVRTIAPRSAVLLSDGDDDAKLDSSAYIMVGIMQGGPAQPDDRGRFARDLASNIVGLRDVKMTNNEPLRIDGSPGYETRLDGVTGTDNTPVRVVQWLRFGSGQATLRIVASAPQSEWGTAFTRFRTVRDSISAK